MQQIQNKNRNSSIELFRFVFACTILFSHYYYSRGIDGPLNFVHGDVGVEFFFLLCGLFMAHSAQKLIGKVDKNNLGTVTYHFIIKKMKSFMPLLIIVSFIQFLFLYACTLGLDKIICDFINSIPYFAMAEESGFHVWSRLDLGVTWYLSAMIIGLLVLFPLYVIFNDISRKILFPIITIFCLGFLQHNYGGIISTFDWTGFCFTGLIRGIGEMAMGALIYDISKWVQAHDFTTIGKITLSAVEFVFIIFTLMYCKGMMQNLDFIGALMSMAIIITLMYSSKGIYHIPCGNRICIFLGSISLPLYLVHLPLLSIMTSVLGNQWTIDNVDILVVLSILFAIILHLFVIIISNKKEKIIRLFIKRGV